MFYFIRKNASHGICGSINHPARATICLMILICFQKRPTALIRCLPHTHPDQQSLPFYRFFLSFPSPSSPAKRVYQLKWSSLRTESFYAAILSTRVLDPRLSSLHLMLSVSDTRLYASRTEISITESYNCTDSQKISLSTVLGQDTTRSVEFDYRSINLASCGGECDRACIQLPGSDQSNQIKASRAAFGPTYRSD